MALPKTGYVRQREILREIPISRATLWRKSKSGDFPRPLKLSARITAWRAEDVRNWIEAREAEARA